jgi:hypothetical protein
MVLILLMFELIGFKSLHIIMACRYDRLSVVYDGNNANFEIVEIQFAKHDESLFFLLLSLVD